MEHENEGINTKRNSTKKRPRFEEVRGLVFDEA